MAFGGYPIIFYLDSENPSTQPIEGSTDITDNESRRISYAMGDGTYGHCGGICAPTGVSTEVRPYIVEIPLEDAEKQDFPFPYRIIEYPEETTIQVGPDYNLAAVTISHSNWGVWYDLKVRDIHFQVRINGVEAPIEFQTPGE